MSEIQRNIKSPTLLQLKKDPARTGSTMVEENRSKWQKCNLSANCCEFQCCVSLWTIQQNITDVGFQSRSPTAWPKALHLAWTHQHRYWIVDDWKHVARSNESHFQLYRANVCGSVRVWVWRKTHESMEPVCQQGTVQAAGGSVMVWGMCSWSDVGPLIWLRQVTCTYASWPFTCIYSCPLWIPMDLGNSRRTMWYPTHPELLQSCFRNTLLSLNTSVSHQTSQSWTLLSISGMPCNVLFRRENLHPLVLLQIYGQPCRMHSVNSLQHYFRL
jgi:hypothetical protein